MGVFEQEHCGLVVHTSQTLQLLDVRKLAQKKKNISFIVADWRFDVPEAKNEIHFESSVGAFLILVSRPQTKVTSGMESDGQSHAFQFSNLC